MAIGAILGIASLVITAASGTYQAVTSRQNAKAAEKQAEIDAAAEAARIEAEREQEKLENTYLRQQETKAASRRRGLMEVSAAARGATGAGSVMNIIAEQAAIDEQTVQQMQKADARRQLGLKISRTNILRRGANLAGAYRTLARQNTLGAAIGTAASTTSRAYSMYGGGNA